MKKSFKFLFIGLVLGWIGGVFLWPKLDEKIGEIRIKNLINK